MPNPLHDGRHPKWPRLPTPAEWVKMQYLQERDRALSAANRVKEQEEQDQRSSDTEAIKEKDLPYRGSLTATELERALDQFQTLLPPTHLPGTNHVQVQEEHLQTPDWVEMSSEEYNTALSDYQSTLPPIPSSVDRSVMATPNMTKSSSTFGSFPSFLTFMTPKSMASVRQKKAKREKISFTVL